MVTEAAVNVYSSHADLDSAPFTASINLITAGRSLSPRVSCPPVHRLQLTISSAAASPKRHCDKIS